MRTKFWQNYFLGKGFAKTSADLFLNSDVANGKGGVWGGIFHLLRYFLLANFGRALSYTNLFFKFFNYLNNCFKIQIFNFFFIFYQMIPRMCFVISVIFKNFRQITQSFDCLVFATKIAFLTL